MLLAYRFYGAERKMDEQLSQEAIASDGSQWLGADPKIIHACIGNRYAAIKSSHYIANNNVSIFFYKQVIAYST